MGVYKKMKIKIVKFTFCILIAHFNSTYSEPVQITKKITENIVFKIICHEDEWVKEVNNSKCKCVSSSILESDDKVKYNPQYAIDNDKNTSWCPSKGKFGNGLYEFIILKVPYGIRGFRIFNGVSKSTKLFYENNRIKKIYLALLTESIKSKFDTCPRKTNYELAYQKRPILLKDQMSSQDIIFSKYGKGFPWYDPWIKKSKDFYLVIGIVDIYKGTKYNDTCISEIEIIK
jgi:hypothetical protein